MAFRNRCPPQSCDTFVALPPATANGRIIFGKNSDRPDSEVQEVVYYPGADHPSGNKVECTYITIDQVEKTHGVVLSRPSWLWGAEMGANEHGVCIGNEAVWGKEEPNDEEALLGMDLVRLGLERAETAEKAVDVLVDLLKKYGQGGNCMEDQATFTYHNSFLVADRKEAWVLETIGKYWAAEKITEGVRNISNQLSITTKIDKEHPELRSYAKTRGWWNGKTDFNFTAVYSYQDTARMYQSGNRYCTGHRLLKKHEGNITAQTMMEILRDKDSGINREDGTTGSMVSILPVDPKQCCIHSFTGTPDPERSVFKPFIFVSNIQELLNTSSPSFGPDDPVKKEPRFQTKPDRRHALYKKHEEAASIIETHKKRGPKILQNMRNLEKEQMEKAEEFLKSQTLDSTEVVHLFSDSVDLEIKIYTTSVNQQ
ncbi:secernin-3 [Callorhinchus milii]|uniref:Secernin 3 n=1 Tax=Callorhinchus milii TaxID=7868 RepID=A0A4W3IJS2_CALMI|nr:secernin-3 [Callorhinchus milii]|eukprot:gi/632945715/ref/XP_007888203.1/ PREDICTED: secernin-3 [Callorhinchus milii]